MLTIYFKNNLINVCCLQTYKPYFIIDDTVIDCVSMLQYDDYKIINIGNNEMSLSEEIILKITNSINPEIKLLYSSTDL